MRWPRFRLLGSGHWTKETHPSLSAHLDVADRQKYKVVDIGPESKGNDKEDAKHGVGCCRFNDHHGSRFVRTEVFPPEGIPRARSDDKETTGDEEGVNDRQSDFEAEIDELGVDIVKGSTARFDENKNRHG